MDLLFLRSNCKTAVEFELLAILLCKVPAGLHFEPMTSRGHAIGKTYSARVIVNFMQRLIESRSVRQTSGVMLPACVEN
jgi:hypothetical protein